MTLNKLETEYRLKPRMDECGDTIIPGSRGHLWLDGKRLCLMATDVPPRNRSKWQELGGRMWLGDISPNAKGKRVQDVKVSDIPEANVRKAMKLAGVRAKRIMSEAQREAAAKGMNKIHGTRPQ